MKFSLEKQGKGPLGTYFFPAVLLVAGVAGLILVLLPAPLQIQCLFRRWTGIPCPTCGGTRCVRQILDGNLLSAFQQQPLIFITFFAGGILLLYLAVAGLAGLPVVRIRLESRRERIFVFLLLIFAVAANWLYLILY